MFREQSQGISGVSFSGPSSSGACNDGIARIFPELHGGRPTEPSQQSGVGALPSLEVQKLTRKATPGNKWADGSPSRLALGPVLRAERRGRGKGQASLGQTPARQPQGKRGEGVCAQADPTRTQALGQMGEKGKGHKCFILPWSSPQVVNSVSGKRLKAPRRRQTSKTNKETSTVPSHKTLSAHRIGHLPEGSHQTLTPSCP